MTHVFAFCFCWQDPFSPGGNSPSTTKCTILFPSNCPRKVRNLFFFSAQVLLRNLWKQLRCNQNKLGSWQLKSKDWMQTMMHWDVFKVARNSFGSNKMCQFFCQNLLFMAQGVKKEIILGGHRAPFFRIWVRTLLFSTFLSMKWMGKTVTCLPLGSNFDNF